MRKTTNLQLPIYDNPSVDKFKLADWNTANQNLEDNYSLIGRNYEDALALSATNANLELVDARGGAESLGEKIRNIDSSLADIAINVKTFGAKGDNITVDTLAIRNAINESKEGETVWIPSGKFVIDDTLVIDKQINFICEGEIIYKGVRDRAAIHFNRLVGKTIQIYKVSDGTIGWHGWENPNYVGVLFENLYFCNVSIINNVENFTVGVRCLASNGQAKGFFFNEFNITQLKNNKTQLEIYKKDPNSWFNSNVFRKTAFTYDQSNTGFQTAAVDRYNIKQTFDNNIIPCDTNIFYDIRFDTMTNFGGTYTAIKLERAWNWRFENYRSELVSGTNVKTIILDCASNQMRGLVFNPIFEAFTTEDNVKVHLLNVKDPGRDYRDIYLKRGTAGNNDMTLLYQDIDFNKKYRQPTADYHIVNGLYRYKLNGTILSDVDEVVNEYATTDRLIENGVTVGTSNLGVLYLKGLKQGDTFTVNLKTAIAPGTPAVHLKAWNTSDVLIDNNEISDNSIVYKALVATNTYWDTTNKRLTQSSQRGTITFSINREEVKTVAILFSGGLNGIEILSNRQVNVLKSIIPNRNNFPNHILSSIPTKKIDGKFLPGDKIFNSNTATGQVIGWELKDVSGTLTWVSLGIY